MESTRAHWLAAGLWMIASAAGLAQETNRCDIDGPMPRPSTDPPAPPTTANAAMDLAQFEQPDATAEADPSDVAVPEIIPSEAVPSKELHTDAGAAAQDAPAQPVATNAAPEDEEEVAGSHVIPRDRSIVASALRAQHRAADVGTASEDLHATIPSTPWYRSPYVALAGVLLLIGLLATMFKRWVPSARPLAAHALQIVGRMPLSGKQSVVLLHIGNRLILVGVTADRMQTLSEITDAQEVELLLGRVGAKPRAEAGFETSLARELRNFDEADEPARDAEHAAPTLEETKGQLQSLLGRLRSLQTG
jgi:flagellar biogenesis protein FliO